MIGEAQLREDRENAGKIILITLDAVRADHMSIYGYKRKTTPQLEKYTREFARFAWAFAPCSYTAPSHASILTGRYPSFHELGFFNAPGKARLTSSVAAVLQGLGYRTAAFVSTIVLSRKTGLDIGFELYDDESTRPEANRPETLWRRGADTLNAALRWLGSNRRENCFLWIHLMDAHGPYSPPEPFDQLFVRDQYWKEARHLGCVRDGDVGGIPSYQVLRARRDASGALLEYERDWNYYVSQYDGCVRYLDQIVGQFIDDIKNQGDWDDTLLIITADHGEAMGENDVFFFHGLTVTPDQVRVPLLLKPSKRLKMRSRLLDGPVSALDIAPTILEATGYDCSFLGAQGRSLWSELANGKVISPRFVFSEMENQCALITGQYHYLAPEPEPTTREYNFNVPQALRREMLFEYAKDPSGMHDISSGEQVLARLRPILQQYMTLAQLAHDRIRGTRNESEREPAPSSLSPDDESSIRRRLARLGYE